MFLRKYLRFILIKKNNFRNNFIKEQTNQNQYNNNQNEIQVSEMGTKNRYQKINYILDLLDKTNSLKNYFYFLFAILGCIWVGYKTREIYLIILQFQKEERILKEFESILTNSIINFVFKNDSLSNLLTITITKFINKDSTEVFISKLLEQLIRSKVLFTKADDLVKFKLLLNLIFQQKDYEVKLRDLLIRVLKNEKVRYKLKETIHNFMIDSLIPYNTVVMGFSNGLSNKTIIKRFSHEIQNFIYSKLDDEMYVKILTESILDLLKKIN